MPRQEGRPHASRCPNYRCSAQSRYRPGSGRRCRRCSNERGAADAAATTPHAASAARPDTFSLGTRAATLTGTSYGVTLTGAVPAQVADPAHQTPVASQAPGPPGASGEAGTCSGAARRLRRARRLQQPRRLRRFRRLQRSPGPQRTPRLRTPSRCGGRFSWPQAPTTQPTRLAPSTPRPRPGLTRSTTR